ncbi:unnamed protein product, partial [Staurois parvus]
GAPSNCWLHGVTRDRAVLECRADFATNLCATMSSKDIKEELENMGQKLLTKLRQIPQADTVEIISFTIILVFIAAVLVIVIVACSGCCCTNKKRAIRVQPKGEV